MDNIAFDNLRNDIENILFDLGKEIKIHKIDNDIILDIDYSNISNKIIIAIENNIIS